MSEPRAPVAWHPDLPIRAPSRGTADQAAAFARARPAVQQPAAVIAYITELWRLAPQAGLDPAILFAQAVHETGAFTSPAWRDRLNPAGIGITDGGDHGYRWQRGEDAARAHVVHMDVYVNGVRASPVSGDLLAPYYALDPRREAVIARGWAGTVRTVRDLTGKWATDPRYHEKIIRWAMEVFGSMSELVFGQVVHPPFVDRLIPDVQTGAWNDLGPRRPVGVCQHSMAGTLWGTDRWFRRGAASTGLTDYGIGGPADGPQWDGVIIRWNDPRGLRQTVNLDLATGEYGLHYPSYRVSPNRAGWANGGSDGLEGDGPLFVRTLGIEAINRDLVSIERSDGGDLNAPVSRKQFESICALTAYWFDQARVPWDRFPFNPNAGCVTHLLHKEFATKDCPFAPVYNRIDEIQDRVRAILKAAQTHTAGEPAIPPPAPVEQDHGRWPNGWTVEDLAARFGALTRHWPDGTTREYRFDPRGPISNAWVARGAAEGITVAAKLPRPYGWWELGKLDKNQDPAIVVFDAYWTLYRPHSQAAWRWVR